MRKNALIIALAVLAVVDIVLVTAAFLHGRRPTSVAEHAVVLNQPDAVPSLASPTGVNDTPTQTLPAMDSSITAASPQRSFIAYGADGAVLRATEGECTTPPLVGKARTVAVQLSVDGGATFVRAAPKVTQVLRLAATSSDNLWLVGTDAKCTPWLYRTFDAGATWLRESPMDTWYLNLSTRSDKVHAPARWVGVGCIPVSMSVLEDSAYVGCTTGQIRATTDKGLTWKTRSSLPGVVALTFGDAERGYALRSVPDCAAAVFSTMDGGVTWLGSACLRGSKPQAIDVTGEVVLAIVDDKLQTSTDGGATWTATP